MMAAQKGVPTRMADEEEESALVNAFFLPGGILDPSEYDGVDDEEENNEKPEQQERTDQAPFPFQTNDGHGPLPENPWANSTQEIAQEHSWEKGDVPPALVRDLADEPQGTRVSENLASSSVGQIGESACIQKPVYTVPQHESAPFTKEDFPNNYETKRETLFPSADWDVPYQKQLGRNVERSNNQTGIPVRAPPGFEQSMPIGDNTTYEPPSTQAIYQFANNIQEQEDDNSVPSDASVPHELFQRESCRESFTCTSSLSCSSTDEASSKQSSFFRDENEEAEAIQTDYEKNRLLENAANGEVFENETTDDAEMDGIAVARATSSDAMRIASSSSDSVTAPISSQLTTETSGKAHSTSIGKPSHSRVRSRHRHKSKRAKTETSTATSTSKTPASQPVLQTVGRTVLDETFTSIQTLSQRVWTTLVTWTQSIVGLCTWTLPFWILLGLLVRDIVFSLIRVVVLFVAIGGVLARTVPVELAQGDILGYLTMAFTPACVSRLMSLVPMPHWLPHAISYLMLYDMLHYTGSEKEETQEKNDVSSSTTSTNVAKKKDKPGARPKLGTSTREHTGRMILRRLKYCLPFFFFVEGFSNEFGMIMSLGTSGRLVVAYVVLILHKDLLYSPMVWLSFSFQLVMVYYFASTLSVQCFIVLVGVGTLRFMTFIKEFAKTVDWKDIKEKMN